VSFGKRVMPQAKTNCRKCSAEILQVTADRTGGLCVPCCENRKVRRDRQDIQVQPGRHVDWMCIEIVKDKETAEYADYFFSSSVSDKDPRVQSRSMIVGHTVGLLRITKASGDVQILYAMPDDDEGRRFTKAASVVIKHWRLGEYPQRTMYACG
jgi:hypothetical protein